MKALVDTCIIVDTLQSREPFTADAQTIFLHAANKRFEGFITAKTSTDIYYLTHRYTHSDKDTCKILSSLYLLFDMLDTMGIDCRKAISSDLSDFGDAVMVEMALRAGMDCIVTRNIKDYSKSLIPVYPPSEFLALLIPEEDNEASPEIFTKDGFKIFCLS